MKKLLASVMAYALCLFVSATDMVVKQNKGQEDQCGGHVGNISAI